MRGGVHVISSRNYMKSQLNITSAGFPMVQHGQIWMGNGFGSGWGYSYRSFARIIS
jgi:hypothetical protein